MHGVPVHCKQAIINIFYNNNTLNDSVIGEASLLLMSLLRLIVWICSSNRLSWVSARCWMFSLKRSCSIHPHGSHRFVALWLLIVVILHLHLLSFPSEHSMGEVLQYLLRAWRQQWDLHPALQNTLPGHQVSILIEARLSVILFIFIMVYCDTVVLLSVLLCHESTQ